MTNDSVSASNEIDQAMITNEERSDRMDTTSQIQQPSVHENSASTTHSSRKSKREHTGRHAGVRNNLASETITIVMEKCKPLILKLRNPQHSYFGLGSAVMPQQEVDRMVDELGNELMGYLTQTVNSLRNEVKQARPQEGEENFEMKMAAYLELINYITNVMKTLTNVLTNSFTEFRQLIDQLWEDIQQSQNENQVQQHVQEFLRKTEQTFQGAVSKHIEPLFAVIEGEMKIPNN